jgi:hypothetical protein
MAVHLLRNNLYGYRCIFSISNEAENEVMAEVKKGWPDNANWCAIARLCDAMTHTLMYANTLV